MNQFTNPSHPRTLSAAVIFGYFQGVFSLLRIGGGWLGMLTLAAGFGLLGGAFLTANNRKAGHTLLSVCAGLGAFLSAWVLLLAIGRFGDGSALSWLNLMLRVCIEAVFPVTLFVAAVHPQSRNWVKSFFE